MIELQLYLYIMIVIATFGLYFIGRVIGKQLGLFKKTLPTAEIRHFRRTLFYISIVTALMGFIPLAINVYSLFFDTNRPSMVTYISLVYALTVHIQALLLSYLLWRLYRLASAGQS